MTESNQSVDSPLHQQKAHYVLDNMITTSRRVRRSCAKCKGAKEKWYALHGVKVLIWLGSSQPGRLPYNYIVYVHYSIRGGYRVNSILASHTRGIDVEPP